MSIHHNVPSKEERTMMFWNIAQAWHGNHPNRRSITTQAAIEQCNDIMAITLENSALFKQAEILRDEIVMHGTKSHKKVVASRNAKSKVK